MLSDQIVVRITSKPGETFLDRMIALVEGASRQKTPNEIALNILLAGLTIIFLLASSRCSRSPSTRNAEQSITVLVALLVCLIPTTIGALLSAIGIAGMDRLVQRNVLAMSGRAVEAAGDCSTLLLDKTGTITYGNRMARSSSRSPASPRPSWPRRRAALEPGRRDARRTLDRRAGRGALRPDVPATCPGAELVSVHRADPHVGRRLRGPLDPQGRRRLGAPVGRGARAARVPADLAPIVDGIATHGGTPLVVAEGTRVLGVIHLKDTVKQGMRERFDELRAMGIRTIMITGDNPLTAAAIAEEAGVDDFLAEATPEDKMALIKKEQRRRQPRRHDRRRHQRRARARAGRRRRGHEHRHAGGRKKPGNMVDLDSNPTKLIEIVEIGKQLLITAARSRPSRSPTTSPSTSPSSRRCSRASSPSSRPSTS